jgi:hypothetical protein
MSKPQDVSVQTYADHEIILPPNRLRDAIKAVLPGEPEDDPIGRAENELAKLASEFTGWMNSECERLDTARREIKQSGLNKQNLEQVYHAAHDIKGHAATYGFPAVAAVGESLCRLIDFTPQFDRIPPALIDRHVDAVCAITREYARSDVEIIATALTEKLRQVTDEFLLAENRSRPDRS